MFTRDPIQKITSLFPEVTVIVTIVTAMQYNL